jgi:hypothetical protein
VIPFATQTGEQRKNILIPGDYVEIVACSCKEGHSRYGVINAIRGTRFLVLLANSALVAQYCLPHEVRATDPDEVANAIARTRQKNVLAAEIAGLKQLRQAPAFAGR